MPKNAWGDETAPQEAAAPAAESGRDWGDRPASQRDLPASVRPSTAGAGRGAGAADPRRLDTPEPVALGDPMGSGAAEILAQPGPRTSVLEGVDIPEPQFNEAEAGRLSRRDYAERTPTLDDPRVTAPSMRSGTAAPENPSIAQGAALADAPMPVRAVAKTVTQGVQGLGGVVRAVGDVAGSKSVANFGANAVRNADAFEQGMGQNQPVEGFGPKSPVPYLKDMAESATSSLATSAAFATGFGAKAVIPLMSIQQAGQTYDDARKAGMSPGAALAYAVPYGTFEAIGEKYQGLDKAAGALRVLMTKGAPRDAVKTAGEVLVHAGIREIPGEVITYLGQSGMDLLPGIGLKQDMTVGQWLEGLRDTVVQAGMMGTATGAGGAAAIGHGRPQQREPSAEEIARAKGFLVQQDRIKQLNSSGEKEVAGTLQRRLDTEQAETELQGMAGRPFADDPDFQQRYRTMRSEGVKPAEASARAAMVTGFTHIAGQTGMSAKAIDAAVQAAATMPLDKVPAFFERYSGKLAEGGIAKPVPQGIVSGAVGGLRDEAMTAALEHFDRNAAAAQAVENIGKILGADTGSAAENAGKPASQSETTGSDAQTAPADAAAPAFDAGNDVRVTPETEAVHAAATSPLNDLPEPTQAQKDAGNYKVGRMRIAGLDISVENPQGSVRRGTDADGKPWETPMRDHYGYVRGTTAADGDKLDVFVKPGTPEDYRGPVFVVDQVDPRTGKFDEHKVVIGATDQAEAEAVYRRNYSADWNGLGAITQLPMNAFQAWAKSNRTKEPLGDLSHIAPAAAPGAEQAAARAETSSPAVAPDRAGAPAQAGAAGVGQVGATGSGAGAQPPADLVPQRYGRDGKALEEGGKPFKTDKAAREARKLQPHLRIVRVDGGFALADKTPAQLAAQAKAAKRLAAGSTERKGEPVAAHAFIAGRGGLDRSAMSELGFDKNLQVGARWLFSKEGVPGLSLEQATELLHQHGYLSSEDQRVAIDTVSRSAKGQPQYTPEGWEQLAEAEQHTRFEDYLRSQQDAPDTSAIDEFLPEELESSGYEGASPDVQAEVRALLSLLDVEGVDAAAILEQVAQIAENPTEEALYDHTEQAIEDALAAQRAGEEDRRAAAGPEGRAPAKEAAAAVANEPSPTTETPADAGVSSSAALTREVVDLRKRAAVLRSLRECAKG